MPGLNSSGENSNAKIHTADEATLDGEIQIQDLVNVSSLNLKTK